MRVCMMDGTRSQRIRIWLAGEMGWVVSGPGGVDRPL